MRQTYHVYTTSDPALARMTASELIRYASSRDAADLGALDGAPIVFTFRRLSRAQVYDFVEAASADLRKWERSFMAGIMRIEGGAFGAAWQPDGLDGRAYVAMSEDEIAYLEDERGLSIACFVDIGQVVYVRSILGPKAVPRYPVSPSSLLAWDALPRPSAEPSPADAPPSSVEPSGAQG